jgi:hypothetical protein
MLAFVGEDGDHDVALAQFFRDFQSPGAGGAGGTSKPSSDAKRRA